MKRLFTAIIITFLICTNAFAQNAIDTNDVCSKAAKIQLNKAYKDSSNSYYEFTATSSLVKIKAQTNYLIGLSLYKNCNAYLAGTKGGSTTESSIMTLTYDSLIIGNKYYVFASPYDSRPFIITVIAGKVNDDFNLNTPTVLTENTPYNLIYNNYSKGRETSYGNMPSCTTTKADSNTIDLYVKFKASATTMSLGLNVDNSNLESTIQLTSVPYPFICNKDYQVSKTQRVYTFTGLTIGTDYTARIELGGDAPLGFARMAVANNASVVLKSGIITSLENETQTSTLSIFPNPSADGKFKVNTEGNISSIKVTNTLGQNEIYYNTKEFSTLLKGLLVVQVTLDNNHTVTLKVIAE